MVELKKYVGSCHCGKVRYEAELDLSGQVIACNCSLCSRMGWLLTFIPEKQFKLLSGGDALTDYQFNKKHLHHLFCRTCGIRSFSRGEAPDGTPTLAVNVRCLEGVNPESLQIAHYDGKSR